MTSYHHFYKQLDQLARQRFPSLQETPELGWHFLISPLELPLAPAILQKAQAAVSAMYRLSRSKGYAEKLVDIAGVRHSQAPNHSVLMAYDFHTNEQGDCFLVEINTNASGYLLSTAMLLAHQRENEATATLQSLRSSFENEARLFGLADSETLSFAIVDEDIPTQKMYPEFLMYRDWFHQQGWKAEICEAKSLKVENGNLISPKGTKINFVYNRLTDFYLENPTYSALHEAYEKRLACISPQPREYWLLADKQRLVQFSQPGFLEDTGASNEDILAIRRVLIPTFEKSAFGSNDEIWANRKSLFFKPRRSFGGKSVYRGESVSRKVFERLMLEDILIQKFQPAQRMPSDDPRSVLNNWKFDLRFYVYESQIQLVVARIYQGKVTNFSSSMGGFTFVQF